MADPFVRKTTDELTALLKGDVDFDNDLILIFDASADTGNGELKRIIPGLLAFETDAATALSTISGQPLNANLTSISALGTAADRMLYTTGVGTWAEATITAYGRDLIDNANAGGARFDLGLETESTDNAVVRFDGTVGETQDSLVTVSDTGSVTLPDGGDLILSGTSQTQTLEADDDATSSRVYTLPGNGINTGGFIPWSTHRWNGTVAQPNWWLGDAGNSTTTGTGNYGFGKRALNNLTTGFLNVAVGEDCLASVTTGIANVAVGESNGMWITTGKDNVAIGSDALGGDEDGAGLTTGDYNIGIGNNAGEVKDTEGGVSVNWVGDNNIAIGRDSILGYADELAINNSPYQRVIIAPLDGVAQADNSITLGRPAAEDAIYLMGETILPNNSATHTLQLGADVELFRSAANTLSLGSGDSLIVGDALTVNGNYTLGNAGADSGSLHGTVTLQNSASGNPLNFGADVSLFRSGANELSTGAGDDFVVGGDNFTLGQSGFAFVNSDRSLTFENDGSTDFAINYFQSSAGTNGVRLGLFGVGRHTTSGLPSNFELATMEAYSGLNSGDLTFRTIAAGTGAARNIRIDPATAQLFVDGGIFPQVDNTYDLGAVSNRWDDIYATNNVIQTSDGRLKTVADTPVPSIAFLQSLRPVVYTWKEGKDTKSKHYGLIAQEVESSLTHAGESGTALVNNEGEYLGMRYTELIPVLIQAIKDQQTQIDELKEQLKNGNR